MTSLAKQLASLKFALQELESAVQQPRDEQFSVESVVERFPVVLALMHNIIRSVLETQGISAQSSEEAFVEAHQRGWIKGEISLWLRLISDYEQLELEDVTGSRAKAVAQDVRACSCILWETFELLTARFRYQTQVQPVQKASGNSTNPRFASVQPM